MSEIVKHETQQLSMQDQMQFAQLVTEGSMVPKDYQNQPANALIAIGLGQSMGLSPAESLYRISVIQGKPTASAELIASNIRKAGHILRVQSDEQNLSVTATVYRADDPEFPHTVTRDMNWAKQMGLASKENYKKQALTMLQWRAISGVGRLACPEALYGVQYTPDELGDMPATSRPSRTAQPVEQVAEDPQFESITADQWRELLAAGNAVGLDPAQVGALAADVLQHDLRGPQDIPANQYDNIMANINQGDQQ